MRRHQTISVALLSLVVAGSGVAHAQKPHGNKPASDAKAGKPAPAPHAEKPDPVRRTQKTVSAPHVEKTAPAPHVKKMASAPHVQKMASAPRVQKTAPAVARVEHTAPAPHVQKPAPVRRVVTSTVVPRAEQQKRVRQQQQWVAQYRTHLVQQNRVAQQQMLRLQQQRRVAQYRFEQRYAARLAEQQRQLQPSRNYYSDPYVNAPYTYGYLANGYQRQTNQYGVDVLRQAVNYGYQEGFQSGQADRQDGWPANYQNSYAYSDANYGYTGYNVDQSDYNYYFRQGFRRGYNDGYYGRSQYGSYTNGTGSILGTLLSAILGLTSLR